jgi:TolB-like protein
MIYRFDKFELDLATFELRKDGAVVAIEPQVFSLLTVLIENRERLVGKDELIEKVWDGRIVSEAALSSRIKSARQALGDDGRSQHFIKTIHGQGFRFIAEAHPHRGVTAGEGAPGREQDHREPSQRDDLASRRSSRPTLAVLPFRVIGGEPRHAALATALPDELITDLAHLRWLLIIARGSSFRLQVPDADFGEIGRLLAVRYCLSGTIEISDRKLMVMVELVDTTDGGIVWAERLTGRADDVHVLREQIRSQVLGALEIRIPAHEASLARLSPVENLDAWSAYHLGLQHLYRFNRADNTAAASLFERAVAIEPAFARAHAGLSFVHFQTAFMRYTDDLAGEAARARSCAERALQLDALDPFVNFTMGRTFWLAGDLESSLGWLERATEISPHYAQGIYARAWTESLAGQAVDGREHVDLAMRLSPLDPLHYAMLATRAFTHMVLGEDAEAAYWAERGARSPGAHVLIAMIASAAQALAGDRARAAFWAANVRERNPALTREDFFRAFPTRSSAMRQRVLRALEQVGFA